MSDGKGDGAQLPRAPAEFVCPLTLQLMRDPAITAHGVTFERSAIEAFVRRHNMCPVTKKPLHKCLILRNLPLRRRIQQFIHSPWQQSSVSAIPKKKRSSRASSRMEATPPALEAVVQLRKEAPTANTGRDRRRRSRSNPAPHLAVKVAAGGEQKAEATEERVNVYEPKGSNFSIPRSPSMEIRGSSRKHVTAGSSFGRTMLVNSGSPGRSTRASFSASYGNKFLSRSQELSQLVARWYRSAGEDKWRMYSNINNTSIEAAYQAGTAAPVRLHGRAAEVHIPERLQHSENGAKRRVLRATWFYELEAMSAPEGGPPVLVPFEEEDAAKLEQFVSSGNGKSPVTLASNAHEVIFNKAGEATLVPMGKTAPASRVVRGFNACDNHRRVVPQLGST